MVMFTVSMIQGIASHEKSQQDHTCLKRFVFNYINTKKGQTGQK